MVQLVHRRLARQDSLGNHVADLLLHVVVLDSVKERWHWRVDNLFFLGCECDLAPVLAKRLAHDNVWTPFLGFASPLALILHHILVPDLLVLVVVVEHLLLPLDVVLQVGRRLGQLGLLVDLLVLCSLLDDLEVSIQSLVVENLRVLQVPFRLDLVRLEFIRLDVLDTAHGIKVIVLQAGQGAGCFLPIHVEFTLTLSLAHVVRSAVVGLPLDGSEAEVFLVLGLLEAVHGFHGDGSL